MLDALFSADRRLSYRRLLSFIVATLLLIYGHIDQTAWLVVTSSFVALEGAERVVRAVRKPFPAGQPVRESRDPSNPQENP